MGKMWINYFEKFLPYGNGRAMTEPTRQERPAENPERVSRTYRTDTGG